MMSHYQNLESQQFDSFVNETPVQAFQRNARSSFLARARTLAFARRSWTKGRNPMRYVLAALLALAIGIATTAPAALAEGNGAGTCYVNGVASACVPNSPPPHQGTRGQ
jgi:hypothetical protein